MDLSSGVGWEFFRAEYVAAMAPWRRGKTGLLEHQNTAYNSHQLKMHTQKVILNK